LEEILFSQNRSINPRKPIGIHFHSNNNIVKDGREDGQCARFTEPKFCIIEVLRYILKTEMESNSFKEYSVLAMMSKQEQQRMKAQCEPTVETKLRESQHDKYKTLPSSREHFTNLAMELDMRQQ